METKKECLKRVNGVLRLVASVPSFGGLSRRKPIDTYIEYLADFVTKNNCELFQAVGKFPDGRIAGSAGEGELVSDCPETPK